MACRARVQNLCGTGVPNGVLQAQSQKVHGGVIENPNVVGKGKDRQAVAVGRVWGGGGRSGQVGRWGR